MDSAPSVKCPRQDRSQSGCLFCIVAVEFTLSLAPSFGKTIFSLAVKLEVGRLPNLRFEKSLLSFLECPKKIVNDGNCPIHCRSFMSYSFKHMHSMCMLSESLGKKSRATFHLDSWKVLHRLHLSIQFNL